MREFLDSSRELLAAGEVQDRRDQFDTAFAVISHLQRVHSKARLDHNNIEAVFSAVDLARTIRKLPGTPPNEIDAALKSLVWLIVRTLEQRIRIDVPGGTLQGTSQYRKLAKLVTELRHREPTLSSAILTFNYDIAIDLSFLAEGVQYSYGLVEHEREIPLLKLHGSLNWGRTTAEPRTIIPYDLRKYREKYRIPWHRDNQSAPTYSPISQHAMTELKKLGHNVEDEPVLVPPTWSKGEYHRSIANVWSRAARELGQAKYIFVLGYSLPETDQFFRLLFALGTEGDAILNKIAIFDPTPGPVAKRFQETLGQAALDRFKDYSQTFEEGLNTIEQLLFATGKRRPSIIRE